jgi:hypothetical protein
MEIKPYNAAFFGLYEKAYLLYRELHGEEAALKFMRTLFERALGPAYTAMGFTKGNVKDFCRVVSERDAGVGLKVCFSEVSEAKIVYEFHSDPFPGLKGMVDPKELDDTYLRFKINFLLGPGWSYSTPQHLWNGAPCSRHVLVRK